MQAAAKHGVPPVNIEFSSEGISTDICALAVSCAIDLVKYATKQTLTLGGWIDETAENDGTEMKAASVNEQSTSQPKAQPHNKVSKLLLRGGKILDGQEINQCKVFGKKKGETTKEVILSVFYQMQDLGFGHMTDDFKFVIDPDLPQRAKKDRSVQKLLLDNGVSVFSLRMAFEKPCKVFKPAATKRKADAMENDQEKENVTP